MADSDPHETNGKRRIDGGDSPRKRHPSAAGNHRHEENNDDDVGQFLALSLSSIFPAASNNNNHPPDLTISPPQGAPFPPPSPPPPQQDSPSPPPSPPKPHRPRRGGRKRNPSRSDGKGDTVTPPYPWATNRRATVYTLSFLISTRITTVSGDVQCKRCERAYTMEYDLEQKFREIGSYIAENKAAMHHRAPRELMNPALPRCRYCDQDNSVRPVIPDKKRSINWLFLLLGKMLGCCTLDQLKYFCKHTENHRTGAKDRVLFLTYLELCKQLDPNGPFAL